MEKMTAAHLEAIDNMENAERWKLLEQLYESHFNPYRKQSEMMNECF